MVAASAALEDDRRDVLAKRHTLRGRNHVRGGGRTANGEGEQSRGDGCILHGAHCPLGGGGIKQPMGSVFDSVGDWPARMASSASLRSCEVTVPRRLPRATY